MSASMRGAWAAMCSVRCESLVAAAGASTRRAGAAALRGAAAALSARGARVVQCDAGAVSARSLIHELFEEQVQKTPDAVAVVYEGERVSYASSMRGPISWRGICARMG